MNACEYCVTMEKQQLLLYADEKVAAFLAPNPATKGHIIVVPREHFPILEQVPDYIVGPLFVTANKMSTVLFDTLQVHGTNIMVENGTAAGQETPHIAVHIIPRSENDGMGFTWEPKSFDADRMDLAEHQLKEQTGILGGFEKEKKSIKLDKKTRTVLSEENYLTKQLRRIPGRWG